MKTAVKISKHIPSVLQGSLDFSPGRSISLVIEHPAESVILRWLAAIVVVFLCAYVYFVSLSVLNVIARKEALAGVAKLQGAISLMERDYFALSQKVVPSEGASLGLAPISNISYVYRSGNTAMADTAAGTIQANEI
jgi:hypothetical protein